ncbi:MAG: hypothetical protein IT220_02540 [Flavobacteriaceae bacterium]|nr:hypothetical protein [Flavobacteriaceae bacterium]
MNSIQQGILISYVWGTPIGLVTVLIVSILPAALTGEGLGTMLIFGIYGKSILGLIISFLIALGIAGKNAVIDIERQKSLLKTSFKYALTVNTIIWTVFILITILDNQKKILWMYLIPPIMAYIFSTIMTTFTLGLLISYSIRKRINKNTDQLFQ